MFTTYQVQLLIYFMLKFAMEILLSESSVVTTFYFNWTTSTVAIFLAVLGLTVLPVNVIVGSYVTNLFQDRYLLLPNLEKPLAIALLFLFLKNHCVVISRKSIHVYSTSSYSNYFPHIFLA